MRNINKVMMFVISVVLLFSVQACLSQDKMYSQAEVSEKADTLKNVYSKVKSERGVKYEKQFFEVFPTSFSLFYELYGYDENGNFHILYEESQSHISLFCKLRSVVDKEKYYEKLINLGISGKGRWQADAVNYLQHCAAESVNDNLLLTITTLKNHSNQEIKNFWYFLFDGPHPAETIPIDIGKIRSISNPIANLAEEAFQQVHENLSGDSPR